MTSSLLAIRGHLLFGTQFEPGTIVVENGLISAIHRGHARDGNLPDQVIDADLVSPGMIDLQVNGADGLEVNDSPENIDHISHWSLASGVTAWLPTIVTAAADHYDRVFATWPDVNQEAGAVPLGLHLEGPFLAPARKGAHQLRYIEAADDTLFHRWLEEDGIRLVTLAPDRPGAIERIEALVERGIVVSLGHTDATIDEFTAGVDAGATKATHLFNAMSPIHHRNPGAMAAVLTDARVTAGIIPDAVHCHPAMIRLAFQAKGLDGIAVVSDMMTACGLGDGVYQLAGQQVSVSGDTARLADGTLAGSMLTMDQAVRNLVAWGGLTTGEAMYCCATVPARLLVDLARGRLVAGTRADLTLWDSDLRPTATFVAGVERWRR